MSAFDDVAPFFHADMGATTAILDDGTAAGRAITCIFDNPPRRENLLGQDVPLGGPQITARSSEVVGLTIDTMVTVGGSDYYVTALEADGQGMTTVSLCLENDKHQRLF